MEYETSPNPDSTLLLTVEQTAAILQLGINRTYAMCRSQGLPAFRVGNTLRVSRPALDAWIVDKLPLGGARAGTTPTS